MENYTIEEAATELNSKEPRIDYLRNEILFSGKATPFLNHVFYSLNQFQCA